MKARPILFSGEMVRALLDGRKTQTRRTVKPQDSIHGPCRDGSLFWIHPDDQGDPEPNCAPVLAESKCPYGVPGDHLWVKETWRVHQSYDKLRPRLVVTAMGGDYRGCIDYRATPRHETFWGKTRVSIFMPPEFSRIKLEITGVRVERLNEISTADAIAEGCSGARGAIGSDYLSVGAWANEFGLQLTNKSWARARYADLWERINGGGSWALNPWVWVIEFRKITP